MKNSFLLVVLFFSFDSAKAQSFQYRNYKFEWAPGKPAAIPVEDQFKNEDAVILEEKFIYNAGGNRVPSYLDINRRANYFFIDESGHAGGPIMEGGQAGVKPRPGIRRISTGPFFWANIKGLIMSVMLSIGARISGFGGRSSVVR